MKIAIYKQVQIDTSHRLLYYEGKCANLHGHRWKIEIWMEGEPDPEKKILIDYSNRAENPGMGITHCLCRAQRMKIAEIFRSNQGEGKNQGKPCLFIRLAG